MSKIEMEKISYDRFVLVNHETDQVLARGDAQTVGKLLDEYNQGKRPEFDQVFNKVNADLSADHNRPSR